MVSLETMLIVLASYDKELFSFFHCSLRSASTNNSNNVGYVNDDGNVNNNLNVYNPWTTVVPA